MINKLTNLYRLAAKYIFTRINFVYTFGDQFIVSLCNFLITIVIVKFLGLKIFGIYSLLWLFVLFINNIQLSYIIAPMFSIAPTRTELTIEYYYGGMFCQQMVFSIISFLIIYLGLKFPVSLGWFHEATINPISLSFAIVAVQIQNFIRRLFFSQKKIISAIFCDLVSYPTLIAILIYLNYIGKLNLVSIFWSYTASFSIGILIGMPNLISLKYKYNEIVNSFQINWPTSKWNILSGILSWFSGNFWFVSAGIILGPFIFGVIRACSTLAQAFNIFFQALENIIPGK